MIRWLLWHLFKLLPTCPRCGYQTLKPKVRFYDGGHPDWSGDYKVCPACGLDGLTYRKHRGELNVYLAGNIITDWRDPIMAIPGIRWMNPVRGDEWFEGQVRQMEEADMVLAYIDTEARHIGTIAELSAFRVMDKPRFLVIDPERRNDRGYVIAEKMASRTTEDMQEAIGWIRALAEQRG